MKLSFARSGVEPVAAAEVAMRKVSSFGVAQQVDGPLELSAPLPVSTYDHWCGCQTKLKMRSQVAKLTRTKLWTSCLFLEG